MHFTLGKTIWSTFALFKKHSLNKTINYFSMQMLNTGTGVLLSSSHGGCWVQVKSALLCTAFGCNNFNTVVLQPGLCMTCGLVVGYRPLSWKTLLMSQCLKHYCLPMRGRCSVMPAFLHSLFPAHLLSSCILILQPVFFIVLQDFQPFSLGLSWPHW